MKAQAGFELYFSISAFVMIVVYLFFEMLRQCPVYFNQLEYERLKSESYQLSQILVNDPGYPPTWYLLPLNATKRIGLNDEVKGETNLISVEKAIAFNKICNDYPGKFRELLDIPKGGYAFYLSTADGKVLIFCYNLTSNAHIVETKRIVAIYNKTSGNITYGELILELS